VPSAPSARRPGGRGHVGGDAEDVQTQRREDGDADQHRPGAEDDDAERQERQPGRQREQAEPEQFRPEHLGELDRVPQVEAGVVELAEPVVGGKRAQGEHARDSEAGLGPDRHDVGQEGQQDRQHGEDQPLREDDLPEAARRADDVQQ